MREPYPRIALSDACEINPRDVNGLAPDSLITFVPMSAVDEKTASISKSEIRPYREVAKGHTPFKEGDVLFAKITPCMENGKCAIARQLENGRGFGSTEFHILRARDKIIPQWVYYFLRQEKVRKFAANNFTGTAGQQRVPRSVFDKLLIPLPPLPIQKQIAAILEKADAGREKRRQANQLTEQFLQSAFLEMFGDPVTNPKRWEIKKLGDTATIVMGQSPQGDSYNYERVGTPLLNGPTEFGIRHPKEKQWTTQATKLCGVGDILFCVRGATAGRLNSADKEYCIGRGLAAIRSYKSNEFVYAFLQLKYQHFQSIGQGSTFINISKDTLSDLPIPFPRLELQEEFAALVEKVESLRAKQRESEKELEKLFNSLMQRAFRGELVAQE